MSKLQEQAKDREAHVLQFMGLQRVTHDLATEQEEEEVRTRALRNSGK